MPSITVVNLSHLHLILNHVPTVGAMVGVGLLLLALVRRDDQLKRAGLEVLFVIALLTLPVYISGVGAQQKLRDRAEFSDNAIRAHHDAAVASFALTEFAGFLAWIALWQSRRRGRAARGIITAVTLLSIGAVVLMARTANLGGDIHHPEISGDIAADVVAPDPERFLTTGISAYMVNSRWAWPAAETVHFLAFSLSFGVLLAVNLRILGVMRHIPFADVHRLLPWGMLGFGANLITGMLFFIGQPRQYIDSGPFYWKVVFLMIAGANFLYLTVFKRAWAADDHVGFDSSLADKAMAVSSIIAWLAVLYAGRMLPFIGHAF
jgi:uncharacterized membrane protein